MITKTDLNKRSAAPPKLPFYIPLFNHMIRSFLRLGVPLGYVGLLTVKGRKTGKTRRNPVGLFDHNGKALPVFNLRRCQLGQKRTSSRNSNRSEGMAFSKSTSCRAFTSRNRES